jgi:hypothetical protein
MTVDAAKLARERETLGLHLVIITPPCAGRGVIGAPEGGVQRYRMCHVRRPLRELEALAQQRKVEQQQKWRIVEQQIASC